MGVLTGKGKKSSGNGRKTKKKGDNDNLLMVGGTWVTQTSKGSDMLIINVNPQEPLEDDLVEQISVRLKDGVGFSMLAFENQNKSGKQPDFYVNLDVEKIYEED